MIELAEGDARVILAPEHGGRLASFQLFERELLVPCDEHNPLLWGCYPMAPWAGRLRHGRFSHLTRHYQVPLTFPPHAIHGTTWNRPWHMLDKDAMGISLGPDWPFEGEVIQRFSLTPGQLHLRLEIYTRNEPFPFSMGWHPWFRRQLEKGSPARLDFEADAMYVRDEEHIPTGEISSPVPGPWDDCFTRLRRAPRITWPGFATLTFAASTDHWVVYSEPPHAICIEPMTGPPDSLNSTPQLVEPGSPLVADFFMEWSKA